MEVRVPFGFWGRHAVRRGGMVRVKAGEVGGGSILKTLWELRLDPEGYEEPCLVVKPEGTTQSRSRNQSLAFSAFSALRPLALTWVSEQLLLTELTEWFVHFSPRNIPVNGEAAVNHTLFGLGPCFSQRNKTSMDYTLFNRTVRMQTDWPGYVCWVQQHCV